MIVDGDKMQEIYDGLVQLSDDLLERDELFDLFIEADTLAGMLSAEIHELEEVDP